MFASFCVVRGCYIFGDTSLAEDAELRVIIMHYACLSAAEMFTTRGIVQVYVISDFIGVHSYVV